MTCVYVHDDHLPVLINVVSIAKAMLLSMYVVDAIVDTKLEI